MLPAKARRTQNFNSEEERNEHRTGPGGAWEEEEAAGD